MDKLIAIYTRKSKYTGIGESIDNQVEMCKKFLINKYGKQILKQIVIFEDEGFTGTNVNRPQFQKMLEEFKSGKYKMLVVYRLDRISRNVLDFCTLKDQLSDLNIDFVSITENFDTSTPMGEAMLLITSVFAQLERNTIAERIKDNMYELAKTGRWLGGNCPFGFNSKKIENTSLNGQKKYLYQLTPNPKEIEIVKLIFNKYKAFKSLSKLETYLIKHNIKTRNEIYFSRYALSNILRNIVYCKADQDIKKFLESKKIKLFNNNKKLDGTFGLISYNKRIQKKAKKRKKIIKDMKDWIIAVGNHEGIIDGKDWIEVWNTLEERTKNKRSVKINTKSNSYLSGILKCSNCGSWMRPKILKTYHENGKRNFVYLCELKSKSKKELCNSKNIKGIEIDKQILKFITSFETNNKEVIEILQKNIHYLNNDNEFKTLSNILNNNNLKIKKLITKLAFISHELSWIITDEIQTLKEENLKIEEKLKKLSTSTTNINLNETVNNIINNYHEFLEKINIDEARNYIKMLISSVYYQNNTIIINCKTTTGDSSRSNP